MRFDCVRLSAHSAQRETKNTSANTSFVGTKAYLFVVKNFQRRDSIMAYSINTYSVKKWDLGELFSGFDSPDLQAAFDHVEEQVASFEGVRNKLKPDMDAETFLDVVRASEETARIVNRVYAFAGLSFAGDTQDQNAQSLMGRVQQFAAEIQNRTLFFNLWWKDVDEV